MLSLLLGSPAALAQPGEEATLGAARNLGYEGTEAYKAGDFETAADKLGRAFEAVEVPTLGLWSARALVKLGRLVEASERYLEVTRVEVTTGEIEPQKQAQAEAAQERQELLPRIPSIRITVEGAEPDEVQVTVDDHPLPVTLLGAERPIDPGTHTVKAMRGEEVVAEEVALAESEKKAVLLRFVPEVAPEPPPAATPPPAAEPQTAPPAPPSTAPARSQPEADQRVDAGSTQRTLGWVALGVGGTGLLVGAITAAVALDKRDSIADHCSDNQCYPPAHDEADTYNSLRTVSMIGCVTAGVGAALGVGLLLTAPQAPPAEARLHARVGLGSAGLVGWF